MKEQWRPVPVPGYEETYQVSNHGRVRSRYRILRGMGHPYLHVILSSHCERRCKRIHRLVAIAFVPNPENKPEVNHKDTNKFNNRSDNLEWTTDQENKSHARARGLYSDYGEGSVNSKLTSAQVLQIRANPNRGMTELGRLFGVSESTVRAIQRGRTWKHLHGEMHA